MPTLIIITGCPGTGKSYLANLLLQRFPSLQLKSYDTLKEEFWDRYGFQDPEEKRRNTACSLQQYYADLARLMLLKTDLLIEYPFHLGHKAVLSQLIQTYAYTAVTILMHGQMDVIYTRSIQRDSSGHRHPGHLLNRYHLGDTAEDSDAQRSLTYEEFLADCSRKDYNIQLGHTISVDVTDYAAVDYDAVLDEVQQYGDWSRQG